MKKLIIYFFITMLAACEMSNEQPEEMIGEDQELLSANNEIVAFYNVENLFDIENDQHTNDDSFTPDGYQNWTKERYDHKLQQIAKVLCDIGKQAPMLIGLVEIENHKVCEELAKTGGLKNNNYKLAHFDSDDRRGIDCALLYDQNRMRVLEKEKLKIGQRGRNGFLTRDILYVKGELKDKEILHVFVNHWSSRREGKVETEHKRIRAAEVLKAKITEVRKNDADAKILVLGDFNDEPKDKSIQQILNAAGPKASLNNLMAEAAHDGEGTIVYEREWYMFDHIIVSQNMLSNKGIRVKSKKGYVYKEDEIIYTYKNGGQKPNSTYGGPEYFGGFSDHLPVYLILEQ